MFFRRFKVKVGIVVMITVVVAISVRSHHCLQQINVRRGSTVVVLVEESW